MKIELNTITNKGISLNETLSFNQEELEKVGIIELKETIVSGKVYLSSADEVILECTVKGIMVLKDSVDNSNIDYQFNIDINEELLTNDEYILEKDLNSINIEEILWQNIVLEIPMRITNKEQTSSLEGEGWELIDEDTKKVDPRLSPLMDLLKEGKE